jgi:hypothetical protein
MKRSLLVVIVASVLVAAAVARADEKSQGRPINVAILLFNQPFITELAGPLDVYHHMPAERLKVFTVGSPPRSSSARATSRR